MNNREAFEALYSSIDRGVAGHDFSTHQDGSYVNDDTSTAFYWFNEGAALAAQTQQPNKEKILIDAITEVLRVLETDNEAILDTVWTTRGDNETLWEHCAHVLEQVTGIEYKPAEQLALDLQSQAQQSQAARLLLLKLEIERICDDVKYAKDAKLAIQKLDFSKAASLPPAPEGCDK